MGERKVCKNCPYRTITCHSHCDEYKAYAKEKARLSRMEWEDRRKERLWYRNG